MIKFRGARGKVTIVGLGLSEENCRRLVAGQAIRIKLRDLGVAGNVEILLFGGKTEEGIRARLAEYVNFPEPRA